MPTALSNQLIKLKGRDYGKSVHNQLNHALFTLNFLQTDAQGRTAADRFWSPSPTAEALVCWKDSLTNDWHGPDPVLVWGRGHFCVFLRNVDSTRWLLERLSYSNIMGVEPNGLWTNRTRKIMREGMTPTQAQLLPNKLLVMILVILTWQVRMTQGDTYWTYFPNPPALVPVTRKDRWVVVWVNSTTPLGGQLKLISHQMGGL